MPEIGTGYMMKTQTMKTKTKSKSPPTSDKHKSFKQLSRGMLYPSDDEVQQIEDTYESMPKKRVIKSLNPRPLAPYPMPTTKNLSPVTMKKATEYLKQIEKQGKLFT